MTRSLRLIAVAALLALGGTAVRAQGMAPVSLAPTMQDVPVGVRAIAPAPEPLPAPLPRRNDRSNSTSLMIVGGAALVVGSLIRGNAGTLIMVSGAVIGLYGLYHYLQ